MLLQASGGDGIFGNGNSSADRFIDLSGKLVVRPDDPSPDDPPGAMRVWCLANDVYRIHLLGSGANVLRDPQGARARRREHAQRRSEQPAAGVALGRRLPGRQLLPELHREQRVGPGRLRARFVLATTSDTNARDFITSNNLPSFTGRITVTTPAINPIQGQTVILDISTKGDGVFDRQNAGTALTDALGNFVVTVGVDGASTGLVTNTAPLPDSSYTRGARRDPQVVRQLLH